MTEFYIYMLSVFVLFTLVMYIDNKKTKKILKEIDYEIEKMKKNTEMIERKTKEMGGFFTC